MNIYRISPSITWQVKKSWGERNEYTFTLHYKYTGVIAINIVIKLSLLHMNNAAKYISRLTI